MKCTIDDCDDVARNESGLCEKHRSAVMGGWDASQKFIDSNVKVKLTGDRICPPSKLARAYIVYGANLENTDSGEKWKISRRYSQFELLDRTLRKRFSETFHQHNIKLPDIVHRGKGTDVVPKHVGRLEEYLCLLLRLHDVQSSKELLAFLEVGCQGASSFSRHYGPSAVLLEGCIDAQPAVVGGLMNVIYGAWWKRRHVVICSDRPVMRLYENSESDPTAPASVVNLMRKDGVTPVEVRLGGPDGSKYIFKIRREGKTFAFRASCREEAARWVQAIDPAMTDPEDDGLTSPGRERPRSRTGSGRWRAAWSSRGGGGGDGGSVAQFVPLRTTDDDNSAVEVFQLHVDDFGREQ